MSRRVGAFGLAITLIVGVLIYLGWQYRAKQRVADELVKGLSHRKLRGEPTAVWYEEDGMDPVPTDARDLRYCGIGTMRMASRGMSDGIDCAPQVGGCLDDVFARVVPCRSVEIRVGREGAGVGDQAHPVCSGGFFGSRVCVFRLGDLVVSAAVR